MPPVDGQPAGSGQCACAPTLIIDLVRRQHSDANGDCSVARCLSPTHLPARPPACLSIYLYQTVYSALTSNKPTQRSTPLDHDEVPCYPARIVQLAFVLAFNKAKRVQPKVPYRTAVAAPWKLPNRRCSKPRLSIRTDRARELVCRRQTRMVLHRVSCFCCYCY